MRPDLEELPERLSAVLEAIYAAFGAGWEEADGAEPVMLDLTREAIYLAELATTLLPNESEAWGLLALMASRRSQKRRASP